MGKLTAILQKHVWCIITFAIFCVFWVVTLTFVGKAGDIASWASLLFAFVVIVYMFYQHNQSEQSRAVIKNEVGDGIHKMTEIAEQLTKRAGAISEDTKTIQQLMEPFQTSVPYDKEKPSLKDKTFEFNASHCGGGGLMVMYSFAMCQEHNKPFKPDEVRGMIVWPGEGVSKKEFQVFMFGVAMGLQGFLEPKSMTFSGEIGEIKNLPPNFKDHLLNEIQRRIEDVTVVSSDKLMYKQSLEQIDAYFKAV